MIVFKSLGGGTDGPTIVLTVVDGKVVIKRVPGWNPEVLAEVTAAVSTFEEAGKIKSKAARTRFEAVAHEVLQARVGEIQEYMGAERG
jgi:hypothetical protein